jgi:hypothetical protein
MELQEFYRAGLGCTYQPGKRMSVFPTAAPIYATFALSLMEQL